MADLRKLLRRSRRPFGFVLEALGTAFVAYGVWLVWEPGVWLVVGGYLIAASVAVGER